MKLISIITPAFNAERYIEKTISSVLNQTYSNWEMIIVDDCSTDATASIAKEYSYKDKRIKVITHEKNQGVAAARNTALKAANGSYIAFLDSDDMWKPEKLEKQYFFMEKNNYTLTYTAYQKYFSDSKELGKVISVPKHMTKQSILYNTSIACLTVMVNKEKTGFFEMPLLNHYEDQSTWRNIIGSDDKAYGLNENLALYRITSHSMTSNKYHSAMRQWRIYRTYYKFSVFKSIIYFTGYAVNAVIKHL